MTFALLPGMKAMAEIQSIWTQFVIKPTYDDINVINAIQLSENNIKFYSFSLACIFMLINTF